ncbi:MAG TPA: (2Fe-2S)-binding protein [Chloroflexota bacterium]|nr:(2Fe-2S)-binding protein [Chloroflexota bacterium]
MITEGLINGIPFGSLSLHALVRKYGRPARRSLDLKELFTLNVNGEDVAVAFDHSKTLLEVLREDLDLTGTKHGCELGECGACTVLVDGEPIVSCLLLTVEAIGRRVITIEGLMDGTTPNAVQLAFAQEGGSQCGYCSPGMILSASALLQENPAPTRQEIKEALAGNLCRCTGYTKIVDAVEAASRMLAESEVTRRAS